MLVIFNDMLLIMCYFCDECLMYIQIMCKLCDNRAFARDVRNNVDVVPAPFWCTALHGVDGTLSGSYPLSELDGTLRGRV